MRIEVKNNAAQRINVTTTNPNQNVGIRQDVITVSVYRDLPKYEGAYDITPRVVEQKMETKDKVMTDDVIIKSIPVSRVENNSGGNTVIIGG